MAKLVALEVEGLADLRKAIETVGDIEDTREFRAAGVRVARDLVVPGIRGNASSDLQQRAAATLRAVSTPAGAAIQFGRGFPGAMGAEFGADRGQRRQGRPGGKPTPVEGWNQFEPWRRQLGYFLFPWVRDNGDEILESYATQLDPLLRRLFPE